MNTTTRTEQDKVFQLAMGRIFRLMSRPTQPGDVEEYERCRAIVMSASEPRQPNYVPNYARDRRCGAAGD
jgi:hypothetical protein